MKFVVKILAFCALNFFCFSGFAGDYGKINIADLVLIYQGGVHRPMEWTKEEFLPYVVHENQQGEVNWLFDGFLFLEFKDGKGRNYAPGYEKQNARKPEWEWLLDRRFEKDKAFSALNQCIEEQIQKIGKPGFKHKLVSGIPSPILDQDDWGELDGQKLDFHNQEDRLTAEKWYIDRFLERYNQENYEHLQLDGFYWVDEDVRGCADILIPLGDYIRSKGFKFYWIPYWTAAGRDEWKKYKFDFAWIQPNHFFHADVSDERLEEACAFARAQKMGVEMEFDGRAMADHESGFRTRLTAYIDAYEKKRVFEQSSVAYYEGGNCIYKFYKSENPKDKEIMDRLAKLIIDRKNKRFIKK
ncbi:DUF4855 domain-containing protein [Maribellus sp. YY47]|uniref:DUF4855 domain-containing protein n=1 Tax=Maribellus sp. YY47 TaxID=2929486 RepID=UPI002000E361|nr:DUF4855 domain-containing protein [Maribellus sp. YY47]MCK3685740.1 DUF4855 domain-containing protein [Maribellus sp. YY47]